MNHTVKCAIHLNIQIYVDPMNSCQDLLILGLQCNQAVSSDFLHSNNIPEEIARTPGFMCTVVSAEKPQEAKVRLPV